MIKQNKKFINLKKNRKNMKIINRKKLCNTIENRKQKIRIINSNLNHYEKKFYILKKKILYNKIEKASIYKNQ